MQFVKGVEEPSVPDVKLTRSKDGSSGTATFVFDQPAVFEASSELGDITGGLHVALLLIWPWWTMCSCLQNKLHLSAELHSAS